MQPLTNDADSLRHGGGYLLWLAQGKDRPGAVSWGPGPGSDRWRSAEPEQGRVGNKIRERDGKYLANRTMVNNGLDQMDG
jgi:hypothetical protein